MAPGPPGAGGCLAQPDDYYYEIQLTNKQLVFYFLAGATGLILSFLAGVMVGRGVDNTTNVAEAQSTRPIQEERVVPEEPSKVSPKPAEELTYAQRLDAEKSDDSLEKSGKAESGAKTPATQPPAPDKSNPKPAASPRPTPAPKASPKASPPAATRPAPGTLTIQVGAFKDKDTA